MYNPPMLGNVNGLLGAINMGNAVGGTNWPGVAYDPETHTVFAQGEQRRHHRRDRWSPPPPGFSDIRYVSGVAGRPFQEVLGPGDCCAADSPRAIAQARGAARGRGGRAAAPAPAAARRRPAAAAAAAGCYVDGLPILKPPYGTISAINLDRGEIVWQVPHGDTPDNVRNHPALKGLNIPKTGQAGTVGHRPDGHQDARRDGRSAGDDDAGASARRDAARLRQDDREGSRRGVDAGAAERIADDLPASTASSTSSSRSAAATTRASTWRSRCQR